MAHKMKFKRRNVFVFTEKCTNCPARKIYKCMQKGNKKYRKTEKGKDMLKKSAEKFIKKHPNYNSEYMKDFRKRMKEKGMCVKCGQKEGYNGRTLCKECGEKGRGYMIQYNEKLRRMKKK